MNEPGEIVERLIGNGAFTPILSISMSDAAERNVVI
jgi:hypothetical protein